MAYSRAGLDRIESKLSNAPRIKSISHFLVNISSIEIMPISEIIPDLRANSVEIMFTTSFLEKDMLTGKQDTDII